MNKKEITIIESAQSVFSRYGVQRTTMNDIAKEAGIARQTLYNTYSNKDEVLRATIRLFTERAIESIHEALSGVENLEDKLDIIFKHLAIEPFEMLHSSLHAEDIIRGMNESSREEIKISEERFKTIFESVLAKHQSSIEKSGLSVSDLSDLVRHSMSAIKHQARDIEHIQLLLNSLKTVIVRCTQ